MKFLKIKDLSEKGATMIEYSLLATLLGVGLITGVTKTSQSSCMTFARATCYMRNQAVWGAIPKFANLGQQCLKNDAYARQWSGTSCGYAAPVTPPRN